MTKRDALTKQIDSGFHSSATQETTVVVDVTLNVVFDIALDPGKHLAGDGLRRSLVENAQDYIKTVLRHGSGENLKAAIVGLKVVQAYASEEPGVSVDVATGTEH